MLYIGIIGTRRRDTTKDYLKVEEAFLSTYKKGDVIVSGGCPKGGDRFAELIAAKLGLTEANGKLKIFRADWKRYGRGAGFVRNTDIAELSNVIIACVSPDRTGGTEDTIKKFIKSHSDEYENPDDFITLC